jgi:3-dehydroquinate dehydratase-2
MKKTLRLLVLNGPNLGHIGLRQPEIYGQDSLDHLPDLIKTVMGSAMSHLQLEFDQLNGEGALIDRLEKAKKEKIDGIVFNAGAYTHTSLALADCLAWIGIPTVEVHMSNILAREEKIRQTSLLAKSVLGLIAGFGLLSYALAVRALFEHLQAK